MKIGQRVYVKEWNRFGKLIEVEKGKPVKVRLDSGQIIDVINLTVLLISKLKLLWDAIKNLFKK